MQFPNFMPHTKWSMLDRLWNHWPSTDQSSLCITRQDKKLSAQDPQISRYPPVSSLTQNDDPLGRFIKYWLCKLVCMTPSVLPCKWRTQGPAFSPHSLMHLWDNSRLRNLVNMGQQTGKLAKQVEICVLHRFQRFLCLSAVPSTQKWEVSKAKACQKQTDS
jgi:hypothetical protein